MICIGHQGSVSLAEGLSLDVEAGTHDLMANRFRELKRTIGGGIFNHCTYP